MTKYFFDVRSGERCVSGTVGMDLRDEAQAIREATLIVWQLLSDASAQNRIGGVSISIRSETGSCVYEASTPSVAE